MRSLWSRRSRATAVLVAVSLPLALLPPSAAAGKSSGTSARQTTKHVAFQYEGLDVGGGDALEQKTSFTPFVFARTWNWLYGWKAKCQTTATYTGSAKTVEVGCNAFGAISGQSSLEDAFDSTQDCHATITYAPDSQLRLGGFFTNDAGTRMTVAGQSPAYGADLRAKPSCGYPPENIEWSAPLDILHNTGDLSTGGDLFKRTVKGILTGYQSTVTETTTFETALGRTESRTAIQQMLKQTADLLAQWLTAEFDTVNYTRQLDDQELEGPWITMPRDGRFDESVDDLDPRQLFTAHRTLSANRSVQVHLQPVRGALAHILRWTTPPKLRIALSFKPVGGSSVAYSMTFRPRLRPTITAVEFRGSAANPTVVVHGRNLGHQPATDPAGSISGQAGCPTLSGAAGSDFGMAYGLADVARNWSAGRSLPQQETDCIGIVPVSFTQTTATFRLGSLYAQNPTQFTLAGGDAVQVAVNGAWRDVHVKYGATVTN